MKAEFIIIQEKIKEARIQQEITQRELAEICDVSEKTISRAEREADKIDFKTLSLIAKVVKIKIEEYIYVKAFSLDDVWDVIEDISKKDRIRVSPVKYNIEKLDVVIRIIEIFETDLKSKLSSRKLRTQRQLLLEIGKLNEMGGQGFYTETYEEEVSTLNVYFTDNNFSGINLIGNKKYIEVCKEFIKS